MLLNIIGSQNFIYRAFDIKQICVMTGIRLVGFGIYLALDYKLIVIEVSAVGSHAEIFAHIFGAELFFPCHKGLVKLFAVACTDDLCTCIAEELLNCLGENDDSVSIGLLNKQISGVRMLKSKFYKINCLIEVHQKAGHIRVCYRNRIAGLDLVDKQRYN